MSENRIARSTLAAVAGPTAGPDGRARRPGLLKAPLDRLLEGAQRGVVPRAVGVRQVFVGADVRLVDVGLQPVEPDTANRVNRSSSVPVVVSAKHRQTVFPVCHLEASSV